MRDKQAARIVGEPYHVGSKFASIQLAEYLPTNLLTHSSGIIRMYGLLKCCQRQSDYIVTKRATPSIHCKSPLEFAYCVLVDFTSSRTEISELLMLFREKKASSSNKTALNS